MKNYLILMIFMISSEAIAAACKKLTECIEISSQLTGKKIIYDKRIVPFTYELNDPVDINKENVDKALSEALNIFGLARIPTNLKATEKVIEARDIRFHSDIPSYEASKKSMPKIPDTHDPIMVTYKGVKGVDMDIIAENVKPLLSRYGRVSSMRNNAIVITDIASHVKKVLPLVKEQDFPLTKEEKDQKALEKKRQHELDLARLKSEDLHEIGPHKHKE